MKKLTNYTIPIITGPTASGKTGLSIELAKFFDTEIISVDSRQIVKEMDIGTAKVTKKEQDGVIHHFIDMIEPTDDIYNSYYFGFQAREVITKLLKKNKNVIIVGGSGLYIQSLVNGFFDDFVASDKEKIQFRKIIENRSLEDCYNELEKVDLECALKNKGNKQRIHRALEVYHFTRKTMSELQKAHRKDRGSYFKPLYYGVWHERETLYNRINERVNIMIEQGLVDEVEFLTNKYGLDLKKLIKTVGYKEIVQYFKGEFSLEVAISEIKKNTRHFAKKQLTWFKKYAEMNWLNGGKSKDQLFKEVEKSFIENKDK